jgi:hypothetical protein
MEGDYINTFLFVDFAMVPENSEGGDPWEEFSRLGRWGSLPPRGRGIA